MCWFTHLMFGIVFVIGIFSLFGWEASLIALVLAGIGALFPDLDASESKLKHLKIPLSAKNRSQYVEPFKVLSQGLHLIFRHRGVMHSLLSGFVLLLAALLLFNFYNHSPLFYVAFLLGYLSHLIADGLTKTGIPLLYPLGKRIRFLPRWLAIATGSLWEILFFVGILGLFALWLSSGPAVLQDLGSAVH